MDKSWISLNRGLPEYEEGIKKFLDQVFSRAEDNKALCLCRNCNNGYRHLRATIEFHLFKWGFETTYRRWVYHGEESSDESEDEVMHERHVDANTYQMIYDYHRAETWVMGVDEVLGEQVPESPNENAKKLYGLLKDVEEELYPGCEKYSKLSFIVELFQMKCLHGLSNAAFDTLFKILKKALPPNNKSPESICPICGESRWNQGGEIRSQRNKIARKVLRYFPLTPGLQRLFMSSQIAAAMRWHKEDHVEDGVLRHPADSIAWKSFNEKHLSFAMESRNARLGLATDGFNPFGNMSTSYSTWPVVLILYNLPPWLCMKQSYFMISSVVPGPKSLAYGSISGWSTKGRLACSSCNIDTSSFRLKYGQKQCYMDYRRFLPVGHPWRRRKSVIGNNHEVRLPPKPPSGDYVLDQYANFEQIIFRNANRKRKRGDTKGDNWKKKSILFELPYWRTQLVRHNLDVMHIEKNICDGILGTLMGLEGKSKDMIKTRLDLEELGIMQELHPFQSGDKYTLPRARYTLSMEEKRVLCKILKDVKSPDGYASNVS
ncbi:uncharacterized protein LOC119986868 [Tripterygium wilfordii]|uniref:uncharacterized protein LOC119986868 n=1 Tax=Tripterygium wilfordii TaxID=458696 RepID=UPI0018F848C6|nr:uncharacterized protein LOC119986868 [Tripterygium wilfordii]